MSHTPTPPTMLRLALLALPALLLARGAAAQVDYTPDGRPWNQRARSGPDADVPGWFYNLGVTGIRVELDPEEPTHLVVRYVFEDSPAAREVEVGDRIVGAGGARFERPHRDGYGMEVFGPAGPIEDFAEALDAALAGKERRLELMLLRDGEDESAKLKLPRRPKPLAASFPVECDGSDERLEALLDHLVDRQREDGSWGHEVHDLFAALALMSSDDRDHERAVERAARYHAKRTKAQDEGSLINWRYMTAAIVLSEYHLKTGERWVLPELEEIHMFLTWSQYVDLSQVNPRVKETHPRSWPEDPMDQHGGWGHNPGFEGYGPIAMITGEGALAFALMARCGVDVDEERHAAAYAFLERGSGSNGYVWYADEVANDDGYADMGRTGAAGLATWLAPFEHERHRRSALSHAGVIGENPLSFPDTHGSPVLGMGLAAAAAWIEPEAFRSLMEANRWWFVLSECTDGTFYYQPNRDNAGYGGDSRLSASAAVAFILSIPRRATVITGRAD